MYNVLFVVVIVTYASCICLVAGKCDLSLPDRYYSHFDQCVEGQSIIWRVLLS